MKRVYKINYAGGNKKASRIFVRGGVPLAFSLGRQVFRPNYYDYDPVWYKDIIKNGVET